MARVLLLVPARTYRALPLDRRLVVRVDPGDLEASVDRLLARSGPVDAVVAVDTPMLVLAAAVAARLGLTHNRVEAVRAAADKATQRRRWAAAGVAQPAFRILPADARPVPSRRRRQRWGSPVWSRRCR
jgi:hypothetical protein